jgi:hypothetical protein
LATHDVHSVADVHCAQPAGQLAARTPGSLILDTAARPAVASVGASSVGYESSFELLGGSTSTFTLTES